jgi:hypothetical protein
LLDDGAGAMNGRASRHAGIRAAVVVLVYFALTIWWLWPLPGNLADQAIYPDTAITAIPADVHLITWALAWDTHALLTHPTSLFDANIFYPVHNALAFSEHFLGYVPLFAPTYLISGNATLAANVVILITFPLCACAAYALARRFVAPPAAFLSGVIFAFSGQRYTNLYHIHQLGTFYLPLALLLTERWFDRARSRDAIALAVVIALQLLSSFYLAYALALLYAVYLPLALCRWRASLDRRRCVGLVIAGAAGGLPMVLASIPYMKLQRLGLIPSGQNAMVAMLLDPVITMPRVFSFFTESSSGPVAFLLAVVALVLGWGRGWYPRAIALVIGLSGLILAAGPRPYLFQTVLWSPYQLLFRFVPGFSAIRLPFRFLVLTQLGVALLAGLALDVLLRRQPDRRAWAAAATALLLLLWLGPGRPPHALHPQPTPATLPGAYRWLAEHGAGRAVLELPVSGFDETSQRMLLSTYHWLPIVDGYSAYPSLTRMYLVELAVRLPDPAALQTLVDDADIGWILVHLDQMKPAHRAAWTEGTIGGLQPVQRWGDDLLFAVVLPVKEDRRALVSGTDRTLGGVPLAPVAAPCPGQVSAIESRERSVEPGGKLHLLVRIDNQSGVPWPAFGLYPRHLVQLRSGFRRRGERVGPDTTTALRTDIAAGGSTMTAVVITAPAWPGKYELDLTLVQDGESLERCGLKPGVVQLEAAQPQPTPAAQAAS